MVLEANTTRCTPAILVKVLPSDSMESTFLFTGSTRYDGRQIGLG